MATILLPLIGGGIGFLVKHLIDKNKDLQSEVTKVRRELYQQFVNLIIDIFKDTKTGNQQADNQLLITLYDFYKKYIMYASPEVINSFSDYFQYLYKSNNRPELTNHKLHFRSLCKIMIAMRKDLGLSNKNLGEDGVKLFRALINDFDKIMK